MKIIVTQKYSLPASVQLNTSRRRLTTTYTACVTRQMILTSGGLIVKQST